MAHKLWKTREADEDRVVQLSAAVGLPRPLARLLVGRGLDIPDRAVRFLNPRLSDLADPFLLPGMAAAVERIWQAIERRQAIVIFGDYDADGVTSTALLHSVLRRLGAQVDWFLPNRFEHGYGLTAGALQTCLGRFPAVQVLITVDCGTGSVEEVAAARARGIDVVVTDHHDVTGARANANALLNPRLGTDAGTVGLAGVGVAFKLGHALVKYSLQRNAAEMAAIDLRDWLDLVAVGTVTDVVPLCGENRILVRHGLARLNLAPAPGLSALMSVAGMTSAADTYHLGYVLGPRLNAAGRLGSAETALRLLLADDKDEAHGLAVELDAANARRKTIEESIRTAAEREIEGYFDGTRDFGLVVAGDAWHEGTIGIVAARLCGRYNRPAAVVSMSADGRGRGSCRSIEGVNLVRVLQGCADLLESHGGHPSAAGLTLRRERLDVFRERFNALCAEELGHQNVRPTLTVDAWLDLKEANAGLLAASQPLQPTGTGNPPPLWGVSGARLAGRPRVVGRGHLKMRVVSNGVSLDAIAFGMSGHNVPDGALDVVFHLRADTYRGGGAIQMEAQDFRAHTPT